MELDLSQDIYLRGNCDLSIVVRGFEEVGIIRGSEQITDALNQVTGTLEYVQVVTGICPEIPLEKIANLYPGCYRIGETPLTTGLQVWKSLRYKDISDITLFPFYLERKGDYQVAFNAVKFEGRKVVVINGEENFNKTLDELLRLSKCESSLVLKRSIDEILNPPETVEVKTSEVPKSLPSK